MNCQAIQWLTPRRPNGPGSGIEKRAGSGPVSSTFRRGRRRLEWLGGRISQPHPITFPISRLVTCAGTKSPQRPVCYCRPMSDRLRVLLISDSALPRHDGIATSLLSLTQLLDSLGFSVTLIGVATDAKCYPYAKVISVPVMGAYHGYPLAWPAPRVIWRAIGACDVVHIHTLGPLGALGLITAKAHRRSIALSVHADFDAYAKHYPAIEVLSHLLGILAKDRSRTRPISNIIRVAAVFADVLVLPRAAIAVNLPKLSHNIPLFIIPNEIAPSAHIYAEYSYSIDIVYVGRMAAEKSVDYLLRCFADRVVKNDGNRHLTLVGDGPELNNLQHYANELGLHDGNITWLGDMNNNIVLGLMSASRILALPSLSEVDPMVLLEAAAAGLPAVVRDPRLAQNRAPADVVYAETCQSFAQALLTAGRKDRNPPPNCSCLPGTAKRWLEAYRYLALRSPIGVPDRSEDAP